MTLRFLGATGTVTGSKFLVADEDARVLVDCGLYQGQRELRRRNWEPVAALRSPPDAVVLSHSHLDHCGFLPRLVRQGFNGPVYCSEWTAQVAPIVLRDAAHLQEEDAEFAAGRGYSKHKPPLPLFTTADAESAIRLLHPVGYDQPTAVASGLELTLRRAGHILGSATVQLRTNERSVLFSGDLGRTDHPLLNPPEPAPSTDVAVIESTYGDTQRPPTQPDRLAEVINGAFDRGGVVLMPAFAIDRTQMLLMTLRQLVQNGHIPSVPVYVDSPMALAALDVYRSAVQAGSTEVRPEVVALGAAAFDPGDLRLAESVEESKRLNDAVGPCIIISASGMATGGRVVHHLERLLPDHRNVIVLAGFQVEGTRGRSLLDGAASLRMFGGDVPVRAGVVGLQEFSAHADSDALLAWLSHAPTRPGHCYVVHGERHAADALAARIETELRCRATVARFDQQVAV